MGKFWRAMLWKREESAMISDRSRLADWILLMYIGELNQLFPRL